MKIFIIRRWNEKNPNNEIRYRLESDDYTLKFDYTSNETSNFKLTYSSGTNLDIVFGDFIYVPDYKWIGVIKEYDKDSMSVTAGDILNVYQMPVVTPPHVHLTDGAGAIFGKLSNPQDVLKLDMFNWTNSVKMSTDVSLSFSDSDKLDVIEFREYAQKILLNTRADDRTTPSNVDNYGLTYWVDSISTIQTKTGSDIKINMVLGTTNNRKTPFAYNTDKKKQRFIKDLIITDKNISYNSVILYNVNGSFNSQWYLDMVFGGISQVKPSTSQYPIYTKGIIYDPSTGENPPTPAQVAAGQLPVNQSNSFSFKFSKLQGYISYEDVEIGSWIQVDIVENGSVVRTVKGSVSKLEVSKEDISVTVGQDTPRLKLSL